MIERIVVGEGVVSASVAKVNELVDEVNEHRQRLDEVMQRMYHLSDGIDNLPKAPSFASDIEFLGSRLSRIEKRLWPVRPVGTTEEGFLPLTEGQKRFVGVTWKRLSKGLAANRDMRTDADEKYQPIGNGPVCNRCGGPNTRYHDCERDKTKAKPDVYLHESSSPNRARWDLIPMDTLEGVARVLGFGAKKYTPNGWKTQKTQWNTADDARVANYEALQRHLSQWNAGIKRDAESGENPLDHAICRLLFLRWFEEGVGDDS